MKKFTILSLLFIVPLLSFLRKEQTWVAIGDSITYLNDHPNETGMRVSKGYLTRVKEKIPNLSYVNRGFNGWTAGNVAENFDKLNIIKGDIYTVFLGTNDWWSGRPVGRIEDYEQNQGNGTFYGSYRIIIDKIRAINSSAKILLITPMQRADFVYILDQKNNAYGSYQAKNGQQLEQFVAAVIDIGKKENLKVLDLYHDRRLEFSSLVKFKRLKDSASGMYRNYPLLKSIGMNFNAEKDEYPYPKTAIGTTYDGLHPSDIGNSVIAKRLVELFKK